LRLLFFRIAHSVWVGFLLSLKLSPLYLTIV
jgi:hypothetical protein